MDAGDLRIRLFAPGDRDRVVRFFAQMGAESISFFNSAGGNFAYAVRQFDAPEQDGGRVLRWLAEDENGEPAGYVFLWDTDTGVPWLGIAVAERWKGRGLGSHLIACARGWAQEHGKGGLLLTTRFDNLRAQRLYEKNGFVRMGRYDEREYLYLLRF